MDHRKPTPLIPEIGTKTCPVCGKPSYSRDGIHPQCAMRRGESTSRKELHAAHKNEAPLAAASASTWKKTCPKCGRSLHVKHKSCVCEHSFDVPMKLAIIAED